MVAVEMTHCTLCGLTSLHPLADEAGRQFCCPACREVYALFESDAPHQPAVLAVQESTTQIASADLALGGLWCSSCAWLISETVRRTPGVISAEASFAQRQVRLTFDPARTSIKQVQKRIGLLGYRAWAEGQAPERDEEERHSERLLIATIFVMHDVVMSTILYLWQLNGAPAEMADMAKFFQATLLFMSIPLMLMLGLPILRAGIASLLRGYANMHALIAIGAFSAFGLSVRNFMAGSDALYFDTASMLLFLVSLGRWLELRAQKNGSGAVERLWKQMPTEALWITADGEHRVPVDDLPYGARVRIHPGERFPVDGRVAIGKGDVDESLLTGEATPVLRKAGDAVMAGTISVDGAFEVITTAIGSKTTAGQIGKMLHEALWDRAPIQQIADRLAALMVPAAVLLSGGTFAYWAIRSGPETGLLNALSVLLIACPCALGIATPLTLWIGVERAAESGIILRRGSALERLAKISGLFFDKTGTLTHRDFQLSALVCTGIERAEFLRRVASAEKSSEHLLGRAIVAAGAAEGVGLDDVTDFRVFPGMGVSARLEDTEIRVGNQALMEMHDLQLPAALADCSHGWQTQGLCVVYAGWDGEVHGLLGLGEHARAEAPEAVRSLEAIGVRVGVLTGDHSAAGARWADRLGVPVHTDLRPEDKIAHIRRETGEIAMVGDGINDGPALASASVGVALSAGTDVARAAADVILLNDDLRSIPWLVRLGRSVMRCVRQNMVWAFFYNLIGIALAVAGLLQPIIAALAMVISSALVTGNALRLRNHPLAETVPNAESLRG